MARVLWPEVIFSAVEHLSNAGTDNVRFIGVRPNSAVTYRQIISPHLNRRSQTLICLEKLAPGPINGNDDTLIV